MIWLSFFCCSVGIKPRASHINKDSPLTHTPSPSPRCLILESAQRVPWDELILREAWQSWTSPMLIRWWKESETRINVKIQQYLATFERIFLVSGLTVSSHPPSFSSSPFPYFFLPFLSHFFPLPFSIFLSLLSFPQSLCIENGFLFI